MLLRDIRRLEDEVSACVSEWQRSNRRWRRVQFCRPATLEPLLDRLPGELVRLIARWLDDGSDLDDFDAYRGMASLLMTNRLLHRSMGIARWALIAWQSNNIDPSRPAERVCHHVVVPLEREDGRTLGYRDSGVSSSDGSSERVLLPQAASAYGPTSRIVIRRLEIRAPELFVAYDHL